MVNRVVFLEVGNKRLACLDCLLVFGLADQEVHVLISHVSVEDVIVLWTEQLGVQRLVHIRYALELVRVLNFCFLVFIKLLFGELAHCPQTALSLAIYHIHLLSTSEQHLRLCEVVFKECSLSVPFGCAARRVSFLAGLGILEVGIFGHDVVPDLLVKLGSTFEVHRGS